MMTTKKCGEKKPNTAKIDEFFTSESNDMQQKNEFSLSLLDGAQSQFPSIAPELEFQRRIASDTSKPLEERLEAYEDIIDSEIGDTNLTRREILNVNLVFGRFF